MRTGTYRASSYRTQDDRGSRLVSVALAIGIAVGIVFALLGIGGIVLPSDKGDGHPLSTFDVQTKGVTARRPAQRKASEQREQVEEHEHAATPPVQPKVPQPPVPIPPLHLPGVLILNDTDYAASDVGRIRKSTPLAPPRPVPTEERSQVADSAPIGIGPGNEAIYMGDWVRQPTSAEMAAYTSKRARTGIGVILCRTAPRNRVEDCREVRETPGTGLARTARLASFQFLIRPPTIGGRPIIGAPVQITYEFTLTER